VKLVNKDMPSKSGRTGLRKGTGKGLTQGQVKVQEILRAKTKERESGAMVPLIL
jgi:hypothetical protein